MTAALQAQTANQFVLHRFKTPIGVAVLIFDEAGNLRSLDWDDKEPRMLRLLRLHYGDVDVARGRGPADSIAALEAYFEGNIAAINNIPCAFAGTDFQRSVWHALRTIPAGETLSYGQLATRIGLPKAVRAVGAANGANPIGLVVPCHRVIGSDGSLTGYGGGLHRKRWLLTHEGAWFKESQGFFE